MAEAQERIPAGHNFVEGVCTVCGEEESSNEQEGTGTTPSEGEEETTTTTTTAGSETTVSEPSAAETTAAEIVPPMVYHTEVTSSKEQILDRIVSAAEGSEVIIDLKGNTTVDKSILDEIAGRDVTVSVKLGGGAYWTINGRDIEKAKKVNMGVKDEFQGCSKR